MFASSSPPPRSASSARVSARIARERPGAPEQVPGGGVVLAKGGAQAAGREAPPRCRRQLVVLGQPELGAIVARPFEMMTEELVQLHELGSVLLQPARETRVQLCTGRLRQRLVGGVAQQQVTEAEAVVAREQRSLRPDQLLADERRQARRHLRLHGSERLHRAPVEDLSLDRAALEDAPLGCVELIEARCEQRPKGGRDHDLFNRLVDHRQHLADEERIPARGTSDALPELAGKLGRDELVDGVVAERLEAKCDRPGRAALDEVGTRHADEQNRCARGEERDVLDQVAKGLLTRLDVIEHDHDWSLRRGMVQRLAEGPGDLVCRRHGLALAEQRTDRRRGGRLRRQRVELLQDLDDRPVRDPVAVGEAAAADDRRLERCETLRNQARLPDAGLPDDRDELAAPLRLHCVPRFPEELALALAPDEPRLVAPRRHVADVQQPEDGNRCGLALQRERLDRLDLDRVSDQRQRRLSDQHLARLRRLLEAGGHVHRITGRQPLLRPRHDLARHHPDPTLQPQLGQRIAHLDRRTHRPHSVVLVHRRHAENRHHGVADELLHAAAVPLDDRPHSLEVAREQHTQPLGIECLAKRGRPGQVAEQHRHRLALLSRPRRRSAERMAALLAKTWRPRRVRAHTMGKPAPFEPRCGAHP